MRKTCIFNKKIKQKHQNIGTCFNMQTKIIKRIIFFHDFLNIQRYAKEIKIIFPNPKTYTFGPYL